MRRLKAGSATQVNSAGTHRIFTRTNGQGLKRPIGAQGAKLKTVDIRNTTAILSGPVYATEVDLRKAKATFSADINADVSLIEQAELIVDQAELAISGTLDLNNSLAAGASVVLGRNILTAAAVNFNDTGSHLLPLTPGGATNGQLVATGAALVGKKPACVQAGFFGAWSKEAVVRGGGGRG